MYQKAHINRFERFFFSTSRALSARLILLATVSLAFFAVSVEAQPFMENPAYSAAYKDLYRTGEGIFVELLSEGRALVYLFSYRPVGNDDPAGPGQAWMVGVGVQVPGGVEVDEMLIPTGGRFGPGFDRDDVVYTPFGSLSFRFPTCGTSDQRGVLNVYPDAGTGFESIPFWDGGLDGDSYIQLTQVVDCEPDADSPYDFLSRYSGSWKDPLHTGEGLILEVLQDGRVVVQWFTYDDVGRQMWVQGVGTFDDGGYDLTVNELNTYTGTHWGRDFKPEEVTESEFGSLTIQFTGCDKATMHYDTLAFGSGTWQIERLTTLSAFIDDSGAGCWDYY